MKDVKICDYLWFQEGPGVRNTQYTTSGVKLINVANLVDGEVDISTSDRFISEEEAYGKYSHFMADEGDFVIASSGIKIDYFEKKMGFIKKEHLPLCMNTSCIRFKVNDSSKLDIKYFMYYLKSNSFKTQLFNQITGSAQLNFGPSHLKKMTFPIIEIDKQHEIVAKLEKTKQIIKSTKALLEKYDFLIKSRFIEMFGDPVENQYNWPESLLCNIADIVSGITKGRKTKETELFEVPYMAVSNVKAGYIDWTTVKSIYATKSEIQAYQLKINDVLMTEGGDPDKVGRGALLTSVPDNCIHQNHIFRVRFDESFNPLYFAEYLQHSKAKKYFFKCAKQTTGIASINMGQLKKLPVLIPPLELQQQFAAFVQQIDKSKFVVQKSLEKAETLYKSLMQEYFG